MPDRRLLFPVIAAVVLIGICYWRVTTNKPQDYADQVAAAVMMRPAPGFEALDSDKHLTRLGTFLGRHTIILLFFDGDAGIDIDPKTAGADKDPNLMRLRERFSELQAQNVKVVAVSPCSPYRHRTAMDRVGKFPFPLLSDIDPVSPEGTLRIHRLWGRLDPATGKPRTGVFLIDRKGQVQSNIDAPKPMLSVDAAIDSALK